jgi:hypothetical protein
MLNSILRGFRRLKLRRRVPSGARRHFVILAFKGLELDQIDHAIITLDEITDQVI